MKKFHALFLPLLLISLFGCNPSEDQTNPPAGPEPETQKGPEKMVVYQMMTRLFGNQNTTNKTHGTAMENGKGTFADVDENALEYLKSLGATHVWYTGVIEHATMGDFTAHGIPLDDADVVKGRAGSPYAIKDYYDVNPDLALDVPNRMQEYEALIERTHEAGLFVIMDFVPNHVARNYASDAKPEGVWDLGQGDDPSRPFDPGNNFYYLPGTEFQVPADHNPLKEEVAPNEDGKFEEHPAKATGNDVFSPDPKNWDWFETAKLNYGVDIQNDRTQHFEPIPATWMKMEMILEFWAGKGVDGFRCDVAEMVPVEFWEWAIPQVKRVYPDIIFIAEIYNPAAYETYANEGGFDYLYDKVGTYDAVRRLMGGEGSIEELDSVLRQFEGIEQNRLIFLENHDEQRIGSEEFAGTVEDGLHAYAFCASMSQGGALLYFGQEAGELGAGEEGFQGDDGRTTIFDYWGVPNHVANMNGGTWDGGGLSADLKVLKDGYATVLNLQNSSPALAGGTFEVLPVEGENCYAFLRKAENETVLVVSHFGGDAVSAKVDLAGQAEVSGDSGLELLFGPAGSAEGNVVSVEFEGGVVQTSILKL